MTKTRGIVAAAFIMCASAALFAVPGLLDTSFNGTGLATTDFAIAGIGNWHSATAVAVDSQRRTVAVGLTTAGSGTTIYDVAIARYNADGTSDTSFHGTGKLIYDVGGDDDAAAVAIDSQDRILVAGSTDWQEGCTSTTCGTDFNFFVLRFNVDGSIDTSYADQGRLIAGFASDFDFATAMTLDASGRAVVAGWSNHGHAQIALLRVLPDGSPDPSFGDDGRALSDYSPDTWAVPTGITIDALGAYLIPVDLAGFSTVARFLDDGTPAPLYHPAFVGLGTGACFYATLTAAAVDTAGRIVATGHCTGTNLNGPGVAILTIRLMPDGALDTTFGTGGGVISRFGVPNVGRMEAHGVAIDALGTITIGGIAQSNGCGLDMLIARFDDSGTPDVRFGTAGDGSSLIDFGSCADDTATAMAVDARGDFLLAGASASSPTLSKFAVARVLTRHPDFRFIEPVAPIAVSPGESGSTTLTVSSIDGFDDTVKIAPFGTLPAGFGFAFDGFAGAKTLTVPAGGQISTAFTVSADATVLPGSYTLEVFDQRLPDAAHTAIVTVNVAASRMALGNTLDSLVQSGAIDDAGIGASLRRQIAAGQYAAARHHVGAQTGKHITADAAAILTANIDDLIRQAAN
jgi:uncharacterized delta-60 repeat protein